MPNPNRPNTIQPRAPRSRDNSRKTRIAHDALVTEHSMPADQHAAGSQHDSYQINRP